MFDAGLRRFIDRPLGRAGDWLAAAGVSADLVSLAGLRFFVQSYELFVALITLFKRCVRNAILSG
jgi:hypothetical protein